MIKRACTILQNGNILGKIFQPHETHVPYILQFMIDYNLHGMSFITLSKVFFRLDSQTTVDPTNTDQYLPSNVTKLSICEVEADTMAEHILNRLEIVGGNIGSNPGIACIWEDEKQRRRDKNLDSQISQGVSQTKRKFMTTATHVMFKQTLKLKLSEATKTDELNKDKLDPNASVYPIETPSDESLLNASQIDLRTPNDVECSFDLSLNDSINSNSNENERTFNDSALFDTDAKNLLEILCDLREKAEIEEDSMLSQLVPKEEDSDSDEESKLSVPLAVTPSKDPENVNDIDVKIPQLDGNSDSGTNFFSSYNMLRIRSLDSIKSPAVLHSLIRKRRHPKKNPSDGKKNNTSFQNIETKGTVNEEHKRNSELNTCQNTLESLCIKIPQLDGNVDSGVYPYNENNKTSNIDSSKLTAPSFLPPKIKRKYTKCKHKTDSSSNKFLLAQSELNDTVITALQQKQITRSLAHKFNLVVREHSTVLFNEHKHKKNRVKIEMPGVELVCGVVKKGLDMPDIRNIHDHDENTKCNITVLKTDEEENTLVKNSFRKKRLSEVDKEIVEKMRSVKKCFSKKRSEKEMVVDVIHPQKPKCVRRNKLQKKINTVELAKQIKKDRILHLIKNGLRVRFKLLSAKRPYDYHSKNDNIQISCPSLDYSFTCDVANPTPYSPPKLQIQKKSNCTSHHSNDNVSKENFKKLNEVLKAQETVEKRFWKLAKQFVANGNISGFVILKEAEKETSNSVKHLKVNENSFVRDIKEVALSQMQLQIDKTKKNHKNVASNPLKNSKIREKFNVSTKPVKTFKISNAIFGKAANKINCGKERTDEYANLANNALNKVINKQLKCLDGANDSSSSEDEDIKHVDIVLKQTALQKKESLSYRPLTVHVESNKKHLILGRYLILIPIIKES